MKSMEIKKEVEWLVSQLNKKGFAQVVTDEEIKQAKEMEKKQIIDAANLEKMYYKDAEDYYNHTFKSE